MWNLDLLNNKIPSHSFTCFFDSHSVVLEIWVTCEVGVFAELTIWVTNEPNFWKEFDSLSLAHMTNSNSVNCIIEAPSFFLAKQMTCSLVQPWGNAPPSF